MTDLNTFYLGCIEVTRIDGGRSQLIHYLPFDNTWTKVVIPKTPIGQVWEFTMVVIDSEGRIHRQPSGQATTNGQAIHFVLPHPMFLGVPKQHLVH